MMVKYAYKHAISAYGAAMVGIPSQIWYGSCPNASHGGAMTTI